MAAKKTPVRRATKTRAERIEDLAAIKEGMTGEEDRVSAEIRTAEKGRVLNAVKSLTVEGVVQETANLGLRLQRSLAGVTEELTQKVQELEDVKAAIALEEEELKRLYNIDTAKANVEDIVKEYDEKVAAFNKDIETRRQQEKDFVTQWQKNFQDQKVAAEVSRRKEEEDYIYNRDLQRRKEGDDYTHAQEEKARANNLLQQQLEAGWAKREETLKAAEKELTDLRIQVQGIPEMLNKETSKAASVAASALKKDLEFQFAMQKKDMETQITIANSTIAAANKDRQELLNQIAGLTAKLEAAQKQVVEVAGKAVEGASGNLAMQKVQETIGTMSTNRGGGKA